MVSAIIKARKPLAGEMPEAPTDDIGHPAALPRRNLELATAEGACCGGSECD